MNIEKMNEANILLENALKELKSGNFNRWSQMWDEFKAMTEEPEPAVDYAVVALGHAEAIEAQEEWVHKNFRPLELIITLFARVIGRLHPHG